MLQHKGPLDKFLSEFDWEPLPVTLLGSVSHVTCHSALPTESIPTPREWEQGAGDCPE